MRSFDAVDNYVNMTYDNVTDIAKDIVKQYTNGIDTIILGISNDLPNESIRRIMLDLSLENIRLAEVKENSALKSDLANAIYKETIAIEYNTAEGTQKAKENTAVTNAMQEQIVNLLYKNVYSLFNSKLDESHRMINTLNSILISRASSEKLTA